MTAVAQLRLALSNLADVPDTAIREAAKVVEGFAADQGRPITIRRKRYRLRAVTKYQTRGAKTITATVFGSPTGFWVWQNTGVRGHTITPKAGTHKGWPRVMGGPRMDHPVSTSVHHPGFGGRGAWRRVDRQARQVVPQIFVEAVHDALRQVT